MKTDLTLARLLLVSAVALVWTGSTPPKAFGQQDGSATPPTESQQDSPAADDQDKPTDKPAVADNPGLPDLDEAIVKKIDAESMADLQEVAALVESAIAKGLDDENKAFAKKMLGGILLERGKTIVNEMLQGGNRGRAQQLRTEALRSFEEAVENDPTLAEAHLQIARLSTLPGGNPKRAVEAATSAIEQMKDDPLKQSEAYVLRAMLREEIEDRLEDLDAAIKADADNVRAYQLRGLLRLQSGDYENGVADLKMLLEKNPANSEIALAVSEALLRLDRREDAISVLDSAITAQPSLPLYLLRSQIRQLNGEPEQARADLDRAIAMDPNSPAALLLRAESKLRNNEVDSAKEDVDDAMALQPGNGRGVFLRSLIAAEQERYADAINDMKLLVRNDPENTTWALQLASYYQLDERPRKAIDVATEILGREPENWQALRLRGDAYLSINQHAEAIADYRAALESPVASGEEATEDPALMTKTSRSGLANNLAWVLATSPQDDLRDGPQSLEFGKQAAELTEYKEPHILSTLAAAYAETGNFEKAVEWAEKAVELGEKEDHEQIEQLQNELQSYRDGKPWREKQETEENEIPILSPDEVIDT